jgi:hypothetical protein
MKNSIMIRSGLRNNSGCESRRRVTVRWPTKAVTTSNKLLQRESIREAQQEEKAHPQRKKKMAHQKRAHPRKLERQTSVLYDGCRPVSLDASPCNSERREETQRKTQRTVKSSEE